MSRVWWVIVGVACVAALVRGVLLAANWDSPFYEVPLVDARDVHLKAVAIAEGDGHPPVPYDRPPLLTYLSAAVYRVVGVDMRAMIVLHAMFGVAIAALVARLATEHDDSTRPWLVGAVAGIVAGTAQAQLFVEQQLLNEPLQTLLVTSSVVVAVAARARRCGRRFVLAAGLAGLAILARPTSILSLAPVLLWAAAAPAPDRRPMGRRSVAMGVLVVLALVGAVVARNRIVGGEWVPISYNGGINFFIGNARNHDDLQDVRPGLRWERLARDPRALEVEGVWRSDPWSEGARAWDQRYVSAALADIASDPLGAVARVGQKLARFGSGVEIERNLPFDAFFGTPAGHATVPAALLVPLGLAGLTLMGRRRHPLAWPLVGWLAGVLLTTTIFFVTARYRVPATPPLAIGAAYLLATGWRVSPRWAVGVVAVTVGLSIIDIGGAATVAPARETFLTGLAEERRGRAAEALRLYAEAERRLPRDPDVLFQPTALLISAGRHREAASWAERSAAAIPDHPAPWFNLGLARSGVGDHAGALAAFRRAADVQPSSARYHHQCGEALLALERSAEAEAAFRRSAALAPSLPMPWDGLARALAAQGRHGDAADARAEATRRQRLTVK